MNVKKSRPPKQRGWTALRAEPRAIRSIKEVRWRSLLSSVERSDRNKDRRENPAVFGGNLLRVYGITYLKSIFVMNICAFLGAIAAWAQGARVT